MLRLAPWITAAKSYGNALLNADRETAVSFYLHLMVLVTSLLWLFSPTEKMVPIYTFLAPSLALLTILNRQSWFPRGLAAWAMIVMISGGITYGAMKMGGPSSLFLIVFAALPAPIFWMLGPRALWPMVALFVVCLTTIVSIYIELDFPAPMARREATAMLVIFIAGFNLFALPLIAQTQLQRIMQESKDRNRQLKRTEAYLQDQQRRQDAFVASVSHELRTPMHAIMGTLQNNEQAIAQGQGQGQHHQLYDAMRSSARHLLTVINDLLDFSQIQSGHLRIHLRPMQLRELMVDLGRMFTAPLRDKGVALNIHIDESLPHWVIGDSDRLTQVIINMLANATKFTARGRVDLTARYDGITSRLYVSVSDTGKGIPKNLIPYVFDRFSRLSEHTRSQFGGTGLGLSISKKIIDLMRGEMGVRSIEGLGSKFWFEVPLQTYRHQSPRAVDLTQLTRSDVQAHILIVDDSPVNRLVAKQMLLHRMPALEITECTNGAEAVEYVRTHQVDLILMDVVMPVMDGIEATKIIKRMVNSPPVLSLTADISESARLGCLEAGVESIIHKPYDREILLSTVLAVLERDRPR